MYRAFGEKKEKKSYFSPGEDELAGGVRWSLTAASGEEQADGVWMDEETSSSRCQRPSHRITDTGECWSGWERAPVGGIAGGTSCGHDAGLPPSAVEKLARAPGPYFLRRPFPCRSGFDGNRQLCAARVTARRQICTPDSDPASTRVMASGGARASGCVAVKSRDPVSPLMRGARIAPIQALFPISLWF
jgi:hypothetical protein